MAATRSVFEALATPVTSAPKLLAICTANVPTPPDAPRTSTLCPGRTRPWSRTAFRAVVAETGTAAACCGVTGPGGRGEAHYTLGVAPPLLAPGSLCLVGALGLAAAIVKRES